jgi:hypothetical protein
MCTIDGHVGGLGAIHHREFAMASGEMDEAQFTEFLARAFGLLARFSLDGALHFVCMDWRHMGELLAAGMRAYTELKNLCVWTKDNAGMGSLYRSQHELVFLFSMAGTRTRTMSSSAAMVATAAMCGITPASTRSVAPGPKATFSRYIRRSSRWRWWPIPYETAPAAARSCSTDFSAAARP